MERVEGTRLDNYLSDARNTLHKLYQQQSRRSGGDVAVADPVQRLLGQLRQWTEAAVSLRGDGLAETPRGQPLHTDFTFLPREMMMKVELKGFEECTLNVEVEEREIRLQLYMESRLAHLGCTGLSVNGVSKIYHLPYPIVPPLAAASVEKNQLTICVPWQLMHTGRSILRKSAV